MMVEEAEELVRWWRRKRMKEGGEDDGWRSH